MIRNVKELAKDLRKKSTNTENLLWLFLKNRQLEGVKFRRQAPMGKYIPDFISHEKKLIVEVDGGQHSINQEKDEERSEWFKKQGYEVLRFWDNDVLKNRDVVLEAIRKKLLTPHPVPLPQGERK